MAEPPSLDHLFLAGVSRDERSTRKGQGDPKIRPIEDRAAHGARLSTEAHDAAEDFKNDRDEIDDAELQSLGVIITIRAASPDFPLKLESFETWTRQRKPASRRPRWLLLAVTKDEAEVESASVWIADDHLQDFFKLFADYQQKNRPPSTRFPNGHPANDELIANMADVRRAVARDLWTSPGEPPEDRRWWELVLRRTDNAVELLRRIGDAIGLQVSTEVLSFDDRIVVWVESTWSVLGTLTLTAAPLNEIRRPSHLSTVAEMEEVDRADYVEDLRVHLTNLTSDARVAVCVLDTGVLAAHALLSPMVASDAVHSAIPSADGGDVNGHGTLMAGLATLGDLEPLFLVNGPIEVTHSLESVKVLPDFGGNERAKYALVTASAVALPEIQRPGRSRVFTLAITAEGEPATGEPTTWSAAIDALAVGADIDQVADGSLRLLSRPDAPASRLFVVSAGNIRDIPATDYLAQADLSGVETPAQAWNALTVGAYTTKSNPPNDPSFEGWSALATAGELSPHSRTGVPWSRQWPNKPDIVCEGGNLLVKGGLFDDSHPTIALTSTSHHSPIAIGTVNATSAATALASNLAARVATRYPSAWPETVRALIVHSAEWTEPMRSRLGPAGKTARLALLRRYGWGVPNEARALSSAENAATIIIEDAFTPFEGPKHKVARFRMHDLPWPVSVLRGLGELDVRLRVTLSHFIEPSVSSRGWRKRYSYASHGFRFELKRPLESDAAFVRRINNTAEYDENGEKVPSVAEDANWYLGPRQRDRGSLIADIWTGIAASLADCDKIAVRAIGGWWKYNERADRADEQLRYSLVMSLDTPAENVNLYTAIVNLIQIGTATPNPITIDTT